MTPEQIRKVYPARIANQIINKLKGDLDNGSEKKKNKYGADTISAEKNKHGIKFDSKSELVMFDLLTKMKILFSHQPKTELFPSVKYQNKTIRAIHYTPDFHVPSINGFVELKGSKKNITSDASLRMRLFLHHLKERGKNESLFLIETKQIQSFVFSIINGESLISYKWPK